MKENDLNLLLVLCKKGKTKQYSLEIALEKHGWKMPHSTVEYMLKKRLTRDGLINSFRNESDNRVYYEISPLGVSMLVLYRKISFREAIEYFQTRPKMYYEVLARMQPNLRGHLERVPPVFLDQLTQDLWIIYTVKNRKELRRQTIAYFLRRSDGFNDKERGIDYELQLMCVNRMEIEGKGICLKEGKVCRFTPSEVAECDNIRMQMEREWSSLM